jgi:hypothetical protein
MSSPVVHTMLHLGMAFSAMASLGTMPAFTTSGAAAAGSPFTVSTDSAWRERKSAMAAGCSSTNSERAMVTPITNWLPEPPA